MSKDSQQPTSSGWSPAKAVEHITQKLFLEREQGVEEELPPGWTRLSIKQGDGGSMTVVTLTGTTKKCGEENANEKIITSN